MEIATFRQIERTSAAEAVRIQLLQQIESGALTVGDRLPSEHAMSRMLGVSRPVVREALETLRAVGMITSYIGRGTFVTANHPRNRAFALSGGYTSDELHAVRLELELPGVQLAAANRLSAHLEALEENLLQQRGTRSAIDWARLDVDFHDILARASGNAVQLYLIRSLRDLQEEQSVKVLLAPRRIERAMQEHQRIYDAVVSQDSRAAKIAMRRHLEQIRVESHELATNGADKAGERSIESDGETLGSVPLASTHRKRRPGAKAPRATAVP